MEPFGMEIRIVIARAEEITDEDCCNCAVAGWLAFWLNTRHGARMRDHELEFSCRALWGQYILTATFTGIHAALNL